MLTRSVLRTSTAASEQFYIPNPLDLYFTSDLGYRVLPPHKLQWTLIHRIILLLIRLSDLLLDSSRHFSDQGRSTLLCISICIWPLASHQGTTGQKQPICRSCGHAKFEIWTKSGVVHPIRSDVCWRISECHVSVNVSPRWCQARIR